MEGSSCFSIDREAPPEILSDEFPLILTTGRVLEHWHTDTITGRLKELQKVPVDFVEVHPADAAQYDLKEGMQVRIRSKRGGDIFRVKITDNPREGLIFTTFHSSKNMINHATTDAYDPQSKQPAFKYCAVTIEPVRV